MTTHNTAEQCVEVTVGTSKFKGRWRQVSVWKSDGNGQAEPISPTHKRPLTFHIPLPAERIIVADHRHGTEPDPNRGLAFDVSQTSDAIRVDDVTVDKQRKHVLPQGIAGRTLSFALKK